jgi:hypothetical protein
MTRPVPIDTIVAISVIVMIVIITIVIVLNSTKKESQGPNCICVFDLDDTLTCGHTNAKTAIDECSKRECLMSINTARTSPYISDISFDKINLNHGQIVDIHHWTRPSVSFSSHEDLIKDIAVNKVVGLEKLSTRYSVPKNRVILFDDNYVNVTEAIRSGFSAIHANSTECGLNVNVKSDIARILGP